MGSDRDSSEVDLARAEIFEAISHPLRINILQAISEKPLGFSDLRRSVGIESNGHLSFHLAKLTRLIRTNSEGNFVLTDDGREALWSVNSLVKSTSKTNHVRHVGSGPGSRRVVIVSLVIVIVGLSSLALYQDQIAGNLRDQVLSSNGQNSSLNGSLAAANTLITRDSAMVISLQNDITSNNLKITSLNSSVSTDASQIVELRQEIATDTLEVASLQSQIASESTYVQSLLNQNSQLQGEVSTLQAPSLGGWFTYTETCSTNCTYTISGFYANYGTSTANATNLTLSFHQYMTRLFRPIIRCVVTVQLGTILGRTVNLLPATTCNSEYPNLGNLILTWSFRTR